MDELKSSQEINAEEIAKGLIDDRLSPVKTEIQEDQKRSILERLKLRDTPALATPDAHGPG